MDQGKAETLSSEFESNTVLLPSLRKPKYIRMLKTYTHTHTHTHTHQKQIVSQSRLSHCLLSPLEQKLLLYMNKTAFLLSSLMYFIYLELIFSNHSGFTSLQTFWDYSHHGTLSLADSSYQEHPSIDITRLTPLHPGLCPHVTCTESPFCLK